MTDPNMNMTMTFVNVGYGEAILLQRGSITALIDGGPGDPKEYENSTTGRIRVIDYLRRKKISHLDLLVATHIHEDHVSGLVPVVQEIPVREFWSAIRKDRTDHWKDLDPKAAPRPTSAKFLQSVNDMHLILDTLKRKGTKIVQAKEGAQKSTDGLTIQVLAPAKAQEEELASLLRKLMNTTGEENDKARDVADASMNNFSLCLLVSFAGRTVLLPGDRNEKGLQEIALPQADIYKVGHHGQMDGVNEEELNTIHPKFVVCCASSDRRYESAAPDLLKMMRDLGCALTFSDCPDTAGPLPVHHALVYTIQEDGTIDFRYGT